ncbi:MAG: TRAP transporter substrate-binding protein [Planctomycetota bacterium]|jgi:tripartite ATP-independent transporter DctP family solute receptor
MENKITLMGTEGLSLVLLNYFRKVWSFKMFRLWGSRFGIMVLASILMLGLTTDSALAEKFTLRVAHYFSKDFAWQIGLEHMDKVLQEKTKGEAKLKIFAGGVLGGEREYFQNMIEGVLDMAVGGPTAGAVFGKEMEFMELPFLFRDYDHWRAVLESEAGRQWADLIYKKVGLKILTFWGGSARNVLSRKRPVWSIKDMKGFKIRTQTSPVQVDIWRAVGALPTPIPYLEAYSAIQTGVVDGMENESLAVLEYKFYEVAPYIAFTEHIITVRPVWMSAKTWRKLPPNIQKAVLEAAHDATGVARRAELKQNKEAIQKMMGKFGAHFNLVDKTPFREATESVRQRVSKDLGLTDLLKKVEETK